MGIVYNLGQGAEKNWLLAETEFNTEYLAKYETIFTLGNGYMGLRAATEEHYLNETRGFYIAGLFDQFPGEVTELPNLPDWVGMKIKLAGEEFNLNQGKILAYKRYLNLKKGELLREVEWESPQGRQTKLFFRRFISLANKHLGAIKVEIKPLNYSGLIELITGFDAQVTNSGTQHLVEGEKRLLANGVYYYLSQTQESAVLIALGAKQNYYLDGQRLAGQNLALTDRRRLFVANRQEVAQNQTFALEKLVAVYTAYDQEFLGLAEEKKQEELLKKMLADLNSPHLSYQGELQKHQKEWDEFWEEMDLKIAGPDFDQLAVRFAQFHLMQMTPAHDERISVAAKGLSGEGYKGHVFWDTEIFILPFFIYTYPEIARKLLSYRYHTLEGARKKAKENGYRGAMFPWESARTGEETTPKFGAVDIKTGQAIRIWCGEIEQHITADIAYALWHYYQATKDDDFMFNYGAEIFLDTARFWASRVEYNPEKDRYEIRDVIGPDEYSEHVDNNAYTNYLVQWHLKKAIEIAKWLQTDQPSVWQKLSTKLQLQQEELADWQEKGEKIYTHLDKTSGLIAQFEGFMEQKEIDLSPYQGEVGAIFKELSWEEITSSQVLKQADVVILLYLLGDKFSPEVKRANWDFYEPKTLHDSSLSPSIHAILAADMDELDLAYTYFLRSAKIDLGENMKSCDAGLHAASLGGVWQAAVMGFAGLRIENEKLFIRPKLPPQWSSLSFKFSWRGEKYQLNVGKEGGELIPLSGKEIPASIVMA